MKKLSLVLAAVVLSASISFAQEKQTGKKGSAATNNTDKGKGAKSTKSTTTKTDKAPAKTDKK
jgi:hypothetical protein